MPGAYAIFIFYSQKFDAPYSPRSTCSANRCILSRTLWIPTSRSAVVPPSGLQGFPSQLRRRSLEKLRIWSRGSLTEFWARFFLSPTATTSWMPSLLWRTPLSPATELELQWQKPTRIRHRPSLLSCGAQRPGSASWRARRRPPSAPPLRRRSWAASSSLLRRTSPSLHLRNWKSSRITKMLRKLGLSRESCSFRLWAVKLSTKCPQCMMMWTRSSAKLSPKSPFFILLPFPGLIMFTWVPPLYSFFTIGARCLFCYADWSESYLSAVYSIFPGLASILYLFNFMSASADLQYILIRDIQL